MRYEETSRLIAFLGKISIIILVFHSEIGYSSQWDEYFKSKIYDQPEQFVVSGLNKIPNSGNGKVAIDLGSGIGHEAKLLLDKGYDVIAVDSNPIAFQYMKQLPGISKHQSHLKTVNSKFESLNFSNLPHADLIVSSFALPFVNKSNFKRVWNNIKTNMKPGGYIIVNLFDPNYSFYNNKYAMSFHTKSEARSLFQGFKIIEFREVRSNDVGSKSNYYVIVGQKL